MQVVADEFPFFEMISKGLIRNAFFSFYVVADKRADAVAESLVALKQGKAKVFVDSGAHSFFTESGSGVHSATGKDRVPKKTLPPEQYFARYVKWLKRWWDHFDWFAELDIGEIVGQARVLEWRALLRQHGLWGKCVPVYHPAVMARSDFSAMLDEAESRYVAVEGIRSGGAPRLPYKELLREAYHKKVRVHGFAMIRQSILKELPFYSVDSSSWKAAFSYGQMMVRQDDGFGMVDLSDPTALMAAGVNAGLSSVSRAAIDNGKRFSVVVDAYKGMEDHYTHLWQARGVNWHQFD